MSEKHPRSASAMYECSGCWNEARMAHGYFITGVLPPAIIPTVLRRYADELQENHPEFR